MQNIVLRKPEVVMSLERLGSMHQSRISFTRSLIRKMAKEKWSVKLSLWDLDANGYGEVIYEVKTANGIYNLVIFTNYIKDEERNDRVIANKWDVTFTFINGDVPKELLEILKSNVPLQEAGRNFNKAFVLARANKSVRVFDYIVDSLSEGKQPSLRELAKVGYILRTTAVYGSGKFGISDFDNLQKNGDFAQSFSAEMCAVYIVRQFSIDWANYIAKHRGKGKAVTLNKEIQRYLGVGNATGLGMAPYLIKHPKVVDNWLYQRENALAKVLAQNISEHKTKELFSYLKRASKHLKQVITIDERQDKINKIASEDITHIMQEIKQDKTLKTWQDILNLAQKHSLEAQEVLNVCLIELYPDIVDIHEQHMTIDETPLELIGVSIKQLKDILENKYSWALCIDFSKPDNNYWFWYISEEKEEPRLGIRGIDEGDELEQPLDIARQVSKFYNAIKHEDELKSISTFLLSHPSFSTIARRVWTMGNCVMGDIQTNILSKDFLPMHLLRAKLAMFGATKYDPRSDRWVQVTLFQGAPLIDELHPNEWLFPLIPDEDAKSIYAISQDEIYVSRNELKAACIKAFNSLKLSLGEPDLIATMVINLEMAGLDGLKHFLKALPYLKNNNNEISINTTQNKIQVNLNNHSILCHIQIIIAYALDYMENHDNLDIEITNCHNRYFVYSQLKRLSHKGFYVKTYWNGLYYQTFSQYSIKPHEDFPEFRTKESFNMKPSSTLNIHISRQPIKQESIDFDTIKQSHEIEANYERSIQNGILLKKHDWHSLLESGKGILVQSSQQSRKDAGGIVEQQSNYYSQSPQRWYAQEDSNL